MSIDSPEASPPETRTSLLLRLPSAADSAAWEEVVQIYGPLVFRMARRQGLQAADADDIVQEVFSAVARQIQEWLQRSDRGPFRAWILRIARNIAVNRLSRKPTEGNAVGGTSQHGLSKVEDSSAKFSAEISDDFDLEYQREVFRWAVDQVHRSVSESTWQAFQLTHIEQIPIATAAEQLKLSTGAVYIARSRIMNRLKELSRQFEVSE